MAPRPLSVLGFLAGMTALCVGCTGAGGTGPTDATTPPGSVDPAILEPLAAFGPCTNEPVASTDDPVIEDLPLPGETIITAATTTDAGTRLEGYLPWTPVQLRVWLQQQDDLEILEIEDEVFEAEALVSSGTHRMFVKAEAVCELGSVLIANVAAEPGSNPTESPS